MAQSLTAEFDCDRMIDTNFRRHCKRLGITYDRKFKADSADFLIGRARLKIAVPTVFLGSAFVIGLGWMLEAHVNLAGPLIFIFGIGFCLSAIINTVQVSMIDLYLGRTATVTASNNLIRCLLGAGATAAVVMKEGPKLRAKRREKSTAESVLPITKDI